MFALLDFFSSPDWHTIMVSNSIVEDDEVKALLKLRFKGQYIERENKGYDFGAWQYAMEKKLIPDDTEFLFLLNDSVFGPLYELEPIIQKMLSNTTIDFWGMTDCNLFKWHLQSYFLCFNKKVFTSKAFKRFFQQPFNDFDKNEIIQNGEIVLSSALIEAGYVGQAYVSYAELMKNNRTSIKSKNPTHFFAYDLIKDYQFPFIKREFIFMNPENVEVVGGILQALKSESSYPISYIEEAFLGKCEVNDTSSSKKNSIDVFCHIYYINTAYNFILSICALKKYNCRFYFNISDSLYSDPFFVKILMEVFKNCIILNTSNTGKDIGGKLSMIDLALRLESKSEYTIVLHDKQSPHTSMGSTWRKKLFRIVELDRIPDIIDLFMNNERVGIVAASEFISNEYNSEKREFACTSNQILQDSVLNFKLTNKDFSFIGGTMFWIRTAILQDFFSVNDALEIRATLEKGNVLDHKYGTHTHAWERLLCWIATAQDYRIKGINEQN